MIENIEIKELSKDKYFVLDEFLYQAIFIPEGIIPPPRSIISLPELQIYIEDFGKDPADLAIAAEQEGQVIGLIWARIMDDYGHVDDQTPSLALSVLPEYRNKGIGTRLMREILSELKERGFKNVSLSVQKDNYATKLYFKAGFKVLKENEEEYIMIKDL